MKNTVLTTLLAVSAAAAVFVFWAGVPAPATTRSIDAAPVNTPETAVVLADVVVTPTASWVEPR